MVNDQTQPSEQEQIAQRRAKLTALRESGIAYPNDFRRTHQAGELHEAHAEHDADALEAGHHEVKLSGRLMTKRVMGKASASSPAVLDPCRSTRSTSRRVGSARALNSS